eukprot:CAMPEP_0201529792 /NCGR_PEP_ID=MMETSP0161_2-20130828/42797_1 /ASSEMBLY_ACC=CAM_ASM_000251 /TAXON_ID=180227 /ORGANISM="Neoparamoeba aestuarina, Strain SoJaBio B1-5/56/2" /LENGTH=34 /DNA_ID= /DNA_START= /DNA_END= /DNA_ORIENTATION=
MTSNNPNTKDEDEDLFDVCNGLGKWDEEGEGEGG